jgi:hypothetical protein
MKAYKKALDDGIYGNGPLAKTIFRRETALCEEISKWIKEDREKIVDLILSPQGMSRGYLNKWVRYANANGMPTLPEENANVGERDRQLRSNFLKIVQKVANDTPTKTQNVLTTLKGDVYYKRKKDGELVPTALPNGEVDRVMRIWDVVEEAAREVMDGALLDRDMLVQFGLMYVHPNEL